MISEIEIEMFSFAFDEVPEDEREVSSFEVLLQSSFDFGVLSLNMMDVDSNLELLRQVNFDSKVVVNEVVGGG